jgi:hypothetical protein
MANEDLVNDVIHGIDHQCQGRWNREFQQQTADGICPQNILFYFSHAAPSSQPYRKEKPQTHSA